MKTYLVGGAVRDFILGNEAHDRDYVVVGATPADMLAAGYKQVGADFPVFLHPVTGDEYALARVERKAGPGYRGFTVIADGTVTLEDDLRRRDLTINAMALEVDSKNPSLVIGELIDPYGGIGDLGRQQLRHTSDAFAEDPLRVLRVARFAAKLPTFVIAPTTRRLCVEMLARGELKNLTQERVWLETYKALGSAAPARYFDLLTQFGAAFAVPGLDFLSRAPLVDHVMSATRGLPQGADIALAYLLVGQNLAAVPDEKVLKGLSATVIQAVKLLRMDWHNFDPHHMYERLQKSGALRGQWEFISLVLVLIDAHAVRRNELALRRVEAIVAANFPTLEGKELGEAIKRARVKAIAHG